MTHAQLTRPVVVGPPPPSSQGEPRRPGGDRGEGGRGRSWWERVLDPVRWEPAHDRLASQPVFAACSRSDVRTLARAGDECFVPAGTVLCRQGRIGYWLFVVTSGSVRLESDDGGCVGVLRSGSHFGDVAILGFGPQPVTAVVSEDATVFVLGRRYVLDLIHSMPGVRVGLFPGVDPASLRAVVRELREAGAAAWRAMPRRAVDELLAGDRVEQLPPTLVRVPSRLRSPVGDDGGGPSPFAAALTLQAGEQGVARTLRTAAAPLDRRVVVGLAALAVSLLAAFAVLFHPDVLVVRPSGTIDVSRDIAVPGLPPPTGRYVVTAVDIEETNLVGLAVAMARGEQTVPRAHGEVASAEERAGRASYHRSQTVAAESVSRLAGVDPAAVRFRDRGLVGPSAGLVYALVLADMAGVVEVPRGRIVAATGDLTGDGRVQPVGYVDVKLEVARRSGATVFLVPDGSPVGRGTVAVSTLQEALAVVGS